MINRHQIEAFIASVSLRMPTIFNKHNFLEGEQYEDYVVLKFKLPQRYTIDSLLSEIESQDGLRTLYHVIPKSSIKKGNLGCAYAVPDIEGCYRINFEADEKKECRFVFVTLYEDTSGHTLCSDLEDELTENAQPNKKLYARSFSEVLLDFMI